MDLQVEATVICRFTNSDVAERVLETLKPDNGEYIHSKVKGNDLISTAESDTLLSLRSTLDDFLACLGTAEQIMKKGME